MAKKSLDNSAARSGSGSITRHPAFPAIVALWFTALLGLGGLLLPVALLERVVEISHIASLVPSAAPPLGVTARMLVALVLAVAGAVLGFTMARRLTGTRPRTKATRDAHVAAGDMPGAATGSDMEESSGEREEANYPFRRRRALAIAELGPSAEAISPDSEQQQDHTPAQAQAPEYDVESPKPGFQEWPAPEETPAAPEVIEIPVIGGATESIETVEFIEPAIEIEEPAVITVPEWPEPEAASAAELAPATIPSPPPSPSAPLGTPLDDLDITQLVERFADTVRRRRAWLASTRLPDPSHSLPIAFEKVEDEEEEAPAVQLAPAPPLPTVEEPAVKRAPFFDWSQHLNVRALNESAMRGFSAPVHKATFEQPPVQSDEEELGPEGEGEAEGENEGEADDAYGSLIEMKNPFAPPRSDFIRIDESDIDAEAEAEPVTELEETLERLDTGDAETSLRAALAKLQQLSGNP